ncbi:hypothetical protein GALL_47060 [mine drainage metagenome]|uniref:Uncharacterized protein n=1 Tax=mine drainage metagenome TaxID=410659 RepID=A0A1J5T0G0_9ZZZZ
MALDINTLINQMVGAAKDSLGSNWPGIKDVATSSLTTIAQNLVDIEKMKIVGIITPEKAALLISMQKQAAKMAIATEVGLGILAAEAAINAALDVVRTAVNTAIGWTLL